MSTTPRPKAAAAAATARPPGPAPMTQMSVAMFSLSASAPVPGGASCGLSADIAMLNPPFAPAGGVWRRELTAPRAR